MAAGANTSTAIVATLNREALLTIRPATAARYSKQVPPVAHRAAHYLSSPARRGAACPLPAAAPHGSACSKSGGHSDCSWPFSFLVVGGRVTCAMLGGEKSRCLESRVPYRSGSCVPSCP